MCKHEYSDYIYKFCVHQLIVSLCLGRNVSVELFTVFVFGLNFFAQFRKLSPSDYFPFSSTSSCCSPQCREEEKGRRREGGGEREEEKGRRRAQRSDAVSGCSFTSTPRSQEATRRLGERSQTRTSTRTERGGGRLMEAMRAAAMTGGETRLRSFGLNPEL